MRLSIPSDVSLMFNSLRLPLSRVNECQKQQWISHEGKATIGLK